MLHHLGTRLQGDTTIVVKVKRRGPHQRGRYTTRKLSRLAMDGNGLVQTSEADSEMHWMLVGWRIAMGVARRFWLLHFG